MNLCSRSIKKESHLIATCKKGAYDEITEIKLIDMNSDLFAKLMQALMFSHLFVCHLINCFSGPNDTLQVLIGLTENELIKNLDLNLIDNAWNERCTIQVCKLLSQEVISSLVLPKIQNELHIQEILKGIVNNRITLKVLNIGGAVINKQSLLLLEHILKHGLVSNLLVMTGCQGVVGTTLTDVDRRNLKTAINNSRGHGSNGKRKVDVVWFETTKYDPNAETNGNYEVFEVEEIVKTIDKRGSVTKLQRFVNVIACPRIGGPWQLVRRGLKRKELKRLKKTSSDLLKFATKNLIRRARRQPVSKRSKPHHSASQSHESDENFLVIGMSNMRSNFRAPNVSFDFSTTTIGTSVEGNGRFHDESRGANVRVSNAYVRPSRFR